MDKKTIIIGIIGVIVIIGATSLVLANLGTTVNTPPTAVTQTQATTTTPSTSSSSSTVPLMQSTGELFTQYKNYSRAHELFPTLASSTKQAMGAFSYTEVSLGNGTYKITLTNNAEDYSGQSVIVTTGQFVYFIEPSNRDDSASEDSITSDDSLVAVDAQGYILQ